MKTTESILILAVIINTVHSRTICHQEPVKDTYGNFVRGDDNSTEWKDVCKEYKGIQQLPTIG